MDLATKAYAELHQLQVLHVDAEPRNILYDAISGTLMVGTANMHPSRPSSKMSFPGLDGVWLKTKLSILI
jgi:hypothetical protein